MGGCRQDLCCKGGGRQDLGCKGVGGGIQDFGFWLLKCSALKRKCIGINLVETSKDWIFLDSCITFDLNHKLL